MRISKLINILEDIKEERGDISVSLFIEGENLPVRTIDQVVVEETDYGTDRVLFEHWERD